MNEKTRKIAIFGLLIVVSIWGYFSITGRMKSKQPKETTGMSQQELASVLPPEGTTAEQPTHWQKPLSDSVFRSYDTLSIPADPFYHNYTKTVNGRIRQLRLLGILYRTANAQALINNQIVRVGDTLQGYIVSEIATNYVSLRKNGKTITLRPKKEST